MNWNNGFSAGYYLSLVDPVTWRSTEKYQLISGTVIRGKKKLIESAALEMRELPEVWEPWIRIWMDARQEGDGGHVAIFTGMLQTPDIDWRGRRKSYSAECCSVLKPADDILLDRGYYVPAGVNAAAYAARLLRAGPAPVDYEENGPILKEPMISENKETRLTMAEKLVDAIGWRIRISGDGSILVCRAASSVSVTYDAFENDAIESAIRDTRDWYSCPNIFRAVSGDLIAVARDDDPESMLSTVTRGREVWAEEVNCSLSETETIAEYAARRLKEEQERGRTLSYSRRYNPELTVGDLTALHYLGQGINGIFRVTSQKISLGHSGRTAEEVEQVD